MLKLILKSFLYLIICTSILFTFNYYCLEQRRYDWGEQIHFRQRISYIQNHQEVNTVFVGSSKIRHHIMPVLFDSICKGSGIKSFNLGSDGMHILTAFKMVEELLNDPKIKLKYLFVDFDYGLNIERYLGTDKSHYWITPSKWASSINVIYHLNESKIERFKLMNLYTKILINKYTSKGEITLLNKQEPEDVYDKIIDVKNQGYNSLDKRSLIENDLKLIKQRTDFLSDTTHLSQIFSKRFRNDNNRENKELKKVINKLLSLADKKGVKIIFIMQPHNKVLKVLKDFEQIPKENRIDLSIEGELYIAENYFDKEHLNDNGARLFTELLAEKFKLIQK